MSHGERRLAAIMFTDMVGYTALGQKNEVLSLALVDEQRKLVRPLLAKHGGREVKTMGDAFLVEFPNAIDAVRCAYGIQRATREFNLSMASDNRIHLRIGVHVGEVVESEGDISGDAVNVASRIEPLAEDGGVCITQQVYDHVRNKLDLILSSVGSKSLKNVDEPIEVYKIQMPWEKDTTLQAKLDSRRIAILPFVSMSPDPSDEYFADGLTEELITRISLVEGLEVIARTSAMNYKKERKNASQIGKELRVGTLLEGSVRKAGNRIRVSAQLINTNTEGHLWAENYDKDLSDIFAVQSSLAESVAGALQLKLLDKSRVEQEATGSLDAYTSYLRATQLSHEATEASRREAVHLFEVAVGRDPRFARAYAGLAHAWLGLGLYEDYKVTVDKAEMAAKKAVEVEPRSAEAHEALAAAYNARDQFGEARLEMEKAVELNPNLAEGLDLLGVINVVFGRLEEGIAYLRRALELDPLSVEAAFSLSHALRVSGRTDEALQFLGKFRELHSRNPFVYDSFATLYFQTGELAKAKAYIDAGLESNPDNPILRIDRGCFFAYSGKRKDAEDELKGLMNDKGEAVRDFAQLFIRTALGDLDEAFEALMRQADSHTWWSMIGSDPLTKALREDPRYSEFCVKVGLSA